MQDETIYLNFKQSRVCIQHSFLTQKAWAQEDSEDWSYKREQLRISANEILFWKGSISITLGSAAPGERARQQDHCNSITARLQPGLDQFWLLYQTHDFTMWNVLCSRKAGWSELGHAIRSGDLSLMNGF